MEIYQVVGRVGGDYIFFFCFKVLTCWCAKLEKHMPQRFHCQRTVFSANGVWSWCLCGSACCGNVQVDVSG